MEEASMRSPLTRRSLLQAGLSTAAASFVARPNISRSAEKPQRTVQRTVIVMCDGFGIDYYTKTAMPTLKAWAGNGTFVQVQGVMPAVTNCNNASICCGTWPSEHGVIGNSYFDTTTGTEEYMEDGSLVLAPTIFERARPHGVASALLTSKKKTTTLLGRGANIVLAAEAPDGDWENRLGKAPEIYSREINYWLFAAAVDILLHRPEIGLLYLHTTDYPMHMWPPEAPESQEHLSRLDTLLAEIAAAAPDAAILLTADHGMNFKSRCWDMEKAMQERDAPIRIAISAERDKYVKHHRGMGGTSWVYLHAPEDGARVTAALRQLEGVQLVLTRSQAAQEFNLMASRIGDLVVIGDRDTVFGDLDAPMEVLPKAFRSHGALAELDIPLVVHNAPAAPPRDYFKHNLDLARWLFA
jgi:phosphonoacetate hydrolase